MNKILIVSALILAASISLYGQNKETILQVRLNEREYDGLRLSILMEGARFKYIDGEKSNRNDWQFIIPDSIHNHALTMKIIRSTPDSIGHLISLSFYDKNIMESWNTPDFMPDKNYCRIEADYIETIDLGKIPQVGNMHLINDIFLYKDYEGNTSSVSRRKPNLHSLPYDQKMKKSIELFSNNRDSRQYISFLWSDLGNYKSKEDIRKLYDCFSDSIKRASIYGKKIEEYLSFEIFPNEELILNGSDKKEYIIKDSTRPNLILFSASWCAPCHKLIPDLKKIYNDLNSKINFTYVSIDDKTTKEQWSKLMIKEDIPWRSLVIYDKDITRIRDKYFVQGVPLSYLVQPDGSFERIDIREEQDMDKLYKH